MATVAKKLTFAEHIYELRKRLMWSLLFIVIGSAIGYAMHSTLLEILQKPLSDSLYYTAPTGAFSFILKSCLTFGFIIALPVVMYQAFGFFEPLIKARTRRSIAWYVLVSFILASLGIAFAYFISLPAALAFLVNFGNEAGDIQALITADEYFNFVLAYVAGFAALFQLPLIITFINRVKPLKPSKLVGGTRYVILVSFIVAALITPTPDPVNQALMAGPIILLYFMSVVLVAFINIPRNRKIKQKTEHNPVDELSIDFAAINSDPKPAYNMAGQPRPVPVLDLSTSKINKPARKSVAYDMVVPITKNPARPARPPATSYKPRPIHRQPRPATPSRTPNMRLISDFV